MSCVGCHILRCDLATEARRYKSLETDYQKERFRANAAEQKLAEYKEQHELDEAKIDSLRIEVAAKEAQLEEAHSEIKFLRMRLDEE